MAAVLKASKPEAAPALFRLLSDSALSRAALGACAFPMAILDAGIATRPVTYVNTAFEGFFGYGAFDSIGRPLSALILRGDDTLAQRLFADAASRWQLKVWGKDGTQRYVELALGALRSAEGRTTHWVAAFSDRSEIEQLRAELQALRSLAATP